MAWSTLETILVWTGGLAVVGIVGATVYERGKAAGAQCPIGVTDANGWTTVAASSVPQVAVTSVQVAQGIAGSAPYSTAGDTGAPANGPASAPPNTYGPYASDGTASGPAPWYLAVGSADGITCWYSHP